MLYQMHLQNKRTRTWSIIYTDALSKTQAFENMFEFTKTHDTKIAREEGAWLSPTANEQLVKVLNHDMVA
jgi:seryl-tRNA synthetase